MLNYKGLKATCERFIVSDVQIDQQINRLLDQHMKTLAITDRPSQLDDELVIDYEGFCDGVQFEGGTAQRQVLTLGSDMFIPGFEAQLVGKSAGEEVEVQVTFPDAYSVTALAGKPAIFKCKIHEIRVRQKYDLDDVFAQEVGGCESLEAMRERIRNEMQAYADQQADEDLKQCLIDQLLSDYQCDITDEQLNKALDLELKNLEGQLARQGLTLDAYCQFTGQNRDQLRADCLPDAKKAVQRQMIIAEIAEKENIEADEPSIGEALEKICRDNGMRIEELQPYMNAEFESAVVRNVIATKVLDCIKSYAEISVVEKHA